MDYCQGTARWRLAHVGLTALLLLPLAACGDDSTGVDAGATTTSTTTSAGKGQEVPAHSTTTTTGAALVSTTVARARSTTVPAVSTTIPPGNDQRVAAARQDLQRRFGYNDAEIALVSVEEDITWPTTALGCPANDKVYAQALVEGYRIVLSWKSTTFKYHGADGELPSLCQFLD